jgi:hypothetical protein
VIIIKQDIMAPKSTHNTKLAEVDHNVTAWLAMVQLLAKNTLVSLVLNNSWSWLRNAFSKLIFEPRCDHFCNFRD